jgi:hypothetical protein
MAAVPLPQTGAPGFALWLLEEHVAAQNVPSEHGGIEASELCPCARVEVLFAARKRAHDGFVVVAHDQDSVVVGLEQLLGDRFEPRRVDDLTANRERFRQAREARGVANETHLDEEADHVKPVQQREPKVVNEGPA